MHETKEVLLSTPTKCTMETSVVTQMLERLEAPLAALLASAAKDSKPVRDLERALMEAKMTVMKKEMEALKKDNENLRTLNQCLQDQNDRWRPRDPWACGGWASRSAAVAALLRAGAGAGEEPAEARAPEATPALLAALRALRPAEAVIPEPPFAACALATEAPAEAVTPAQPEGSDGDEDLYS